MESHQEASDDGSDWTESDGFRVSTGGPVTVLTFEELTEIKIDGRVFRFSTPQRCLVSQEEGVWSHELLDLGIHGYGESESESSQRMALDLRVCWDEIANEVDERLSGDARQLKQRLLAAVHAS